MVARSESTRAPPRDRDQLAVLEATAIVAKVVATVTAEAVVEDTVIAVAGEVMVIAVVAVAMVIAGIVVVMAETAADMVGIVIAIVVVVVAVTVEMTAGAEEVEEEGVLATGSNAGTAVSVTRAAIPTTALPGAEVGAVAERVAENLTGRTVIQRTPNEEVLTFLAGADAGKPE